MVTNLTLPIANIEVHCVVAVDCFIKSVEVCPLKSKDVSTLANWFYFHLIARFSKLKYMWVNRSWEFIGSFVQLCQSLGIIIYLASAGYQPSNG